MSLRLRLIISFIIIASLVFIVGIVGIVSANRITSTSEIIIRRTSPSLTELAEIEAAGNAMRETAIHHAMFRRIGSPSIEDQEYAAAKQELETHLAELKEFTNDSNLYKAIEAAIPGYVSTTQNLIDVANRNADDTALFAATEAIEPAESAFSAAIEKALADAEAELKQNIQDTENAAGSAVTTNIISIVAVMVLYAPSLICRSLPPV